MARGAYATEVIQCSGFPVPVQHSCGAAHLQALHNSLDDLVLQATVFALCVFSNGDEVDVVIFRLVSWKAEARSHVCVQLQLLSQGQVQGPMPLTNGGGHGPFQADSVRLQSHKTLFCILKNEEGGECCASKVVQVEKDQLAEHSARHC